MSRVILTILLMFCGCSWTAGEQTCSLSGKILHASFIFNQFLFYYMRAAASASAESVDGPRPAVRVTWNTTVPPGCVTSLRVEFRTGSAGPTGHLEATYTATNTSQTEVIQTGLQCATSYYITVVLTGGASNAVHYSRPVQVLVGGKVIVCMWYV